MNMGFGPPVPEPFGGDFWGLAENEVNQQYPDQPNGMLDCLENSIEQSLPVVGMANAQPDLMLDLVEHSTETQEFPDSELPKHLQDHRLWGLMDALELSTENQVIKPENPVQPAVPETNEAYGSFPQTIVPRSRETWFARERLYPEHRMTGSRTGLRFNGGSRTYCHLREAWVSQDECDSCSAFEPAEDTSGGEGSCHYAC